MRFLSHSPKEKKFLAGDDPKGNAESDSEHEKKTFLDAHLAYVAKKSKELAQESRFKNENIAYYAGLFHDLGKLNPYYQELFSNKKQESEKYEPFHSPYSGWIAQNLLKEINELDPIDKQRVLAIIYGHHSSLRQTPGNHSPSKEKGAITTPKVIENWKEFTNGKCNHNEFDSVSQNIQLNEKRFKFDRMLKKKPDENSFTAFLECGYYFSCVLQADRSSFGYFEPKKLPDDFDLDTGLLHKDQSKNTRLNELRQKYATHVSDSFDDTNSISIINAPTGSGKTAVFLDTIKKYKPHRVFYFSPLLALTDNFASKITESKIMDTEDVLVYHHLVSSTLDKIDEKNVEHKWNFDFEILNSPFVITTTQRLLMSVYSNTAKDKIKLASFRDSLLIIDEVQTLPKFLLKNLIEFFETMREHLNIKVLLVSATIPYEISHLPKYSMQDDDYKEYLELKDRKIKIEKGALEPNNVSPNSMVMLNTRRAAKKIFCELQNLDKDVCYVSSGITKRERKEIIEHKTKDSILVCTQVLEAGVDISFSSIWRQMAPLDNIIQVLGRLDREAEDKNSTAIIFDVDNRKFTPYSSLEYQESQKIIKGISSSKELYDKLDSYYKDISEQNQTQKQYADTLDGYIDKLDFDATWDFVQKSIGEQYYDSVYIPDKSNWEQIHDDLASKSKSRKKKHSDLVALMPTPVYKMQDYFDEELYDQGIFLPKYDKLDEIYDKDIGLDKWIND